MRSQIGLAILLAVVAGLAGCKSLNPASEEPGQTSRTNVADEEKNWATKFRPREPGSQPYFFDGQARQIERNLGI